MNRNFTDEFGSHAPCPPRGELWKDLDRPEMRQAIENASVVVGFDVHDTEKQYLFFGRETLGQLLATGSCQRMDVVKVAVDFFTDDAEVLWAACVAMKGSCCYDEFAEVPPVIIPIGA